MFFLFQRDISPIQFPSINSFRCYRKNSKTEGSPFFIDHGMQQRTQIWMRFSRQVFIPSPPLKEKTSVEILKKSLVRGGRVECSQTSHISYILPTSAEDLVISCQNSPQLSKRFFVESFVWLIQAEIFILNFSKYRAFTPARVPTILLGHGAPIARYTREAHCWESHYLTCKIDFLCFQMPRCMP